MDKITLAAARTNAGYSQKAAGIALGVSNKTICSWEKGKTFPNQPMIEKICKLYRTSYDCIKFTAN